MEAMVYAKSCVRCGLCAALCPAVFSLPPDGPAAASSGPLNTQCQPAVQQAAQDCPTGAIELRP